jgi:protein TonB
VEAFRVGGDVLPPQVLVRVQPDYSKLHDFQFYGTPIFEAVVSAEGDVTKVRVVRSGSPEVDTVIVDALKQWKFQPATRNGTPVPVYFTMTVNLHPGR